jgi:transcriptional regulator with XRE-family HTH domain
MAIAERINYFRNKCGMTMKHLGQRLGYAEKSADVRVAQYESGNRKPKEDTIHALAEIFDVAPAALDVPDIDSYIGIMHTLFVLEDQYDLSADLIDGEPVLRFGTDIKKRDFLWNLFTSWAAEAARYRAGEISEEDYNAWRYHYPKFDKGNIWAKVPPDLK